MNLVEAVREDLWYLEAVDGEDSLAASRRMVDSLARIESLKPFPAVAQKLLAMLDDPNFEVSLVTLAIEEDPALASNVLRVANSALFSGLNASKTIRQAFVRLGVVSLRELVISATISGLFRDATGIGRKIRDHCAGTAALIRLLAKELCLEGVDDAFLCALMHDLGKLLLIQRGDPLYQQVLDSDELLRPDRVHHAERRALGFDHAVLGGHVMLLWKIPEPVSRVVAWHHQPARAAHEPAIARLLCLVRLADRIEPLLIPGQEPSDESLQAIFLAPECAELGIQPVFLQDHWQSLAKCRQRALDLFGG